MTFEELCEFYKNGQLSTTEFKQNFRELKAQSSRKMVTANKSIFFAECQRINRVKEGRPVFWVHGAFGDAAVFIPLAERVNRPFYGIQARGLFDDKTPLIGVEKIAALYRKRIQSIQPNGPYDLGGYSAGGVLVYEVVRQLQTAGQCVHSLTLIDPLYPPFHKSLEGNFYDTLCFLSLSLIDMTFRHHSEKSIEIIDTLELPSKKETDKEILTEFFIQYCLRAGVNKPEAWIRNFIKKMAQIQKGYKLSDYIPCPLPSEVSCVRYFKNRDGLFFGQKAAHLNPHRDDPLQGVDYWSQWKDVLPTITFSEVIADNHLMIFDENSALKKISEYCQQIYDVKIDDCSVLLSHLPSERQVDQYSNERLEDGAISYLKRLFSSTLKRPVSEIRSSTFFEEYGIDSFMALQLANALQNVFGSLSVTLLFEYGTIKELAGYFLASHGKKFQELLGIHEKTEEDPVVKSERLQKQITVSDSVLKTPDIAIIGLSGRYPGAVTIDAFWQILRDGKDCITEVPKKRWNWRAYYKPDQKRRGYHSSKWGGFIEDVDAFDPLFFNISPREAEFIDPQERLFLEHAWTAMEDAGYCRDAFHRKDGPYLSAQVGVYAGVMASEYQFFGVEASLRGERMAFAGNPGSIANRVSYTLNLNGPSMTVDTACSSSLTAINLACQDLKLGKTNLAIAGGVNISIHSNKYLGLSSGQFISSRGRCESFGAGGDGYIPAEGVGVMLLKRLSEAESDGDHIYGVIKGSAINHGGKSNGYTVPNPRTQQMAIVQALDEARIDARMVSYIEAHGTGTKLGDPIEITGLTKAFRRQTQDTGYCWIGSAKSNIGHAEAAAGIAGLTKVLLQMKHRQLVPSLHSKNLNPHIDFNATPFVVNQKLQPWERPIIDGKSLPLIAGISSFGAGGSNAHIIIEEHIVRERAQIIVTPRNPAIIVLSAKDNNRLRVVGTQLFEYLEKNQHLKDGDLSDIAYTLQVGREAMEERLAMIVSSMAELKEKLKNFSDPIGNNQEQGTDFRHGHVEGNDDLSTLFERDEQLQEAIDKWIKLRKFSKLIYLWVKGYSLDWNRLYTVSNPFRISLPTYPFERQRYWISDNTRDVGGDFGSDEASPSSETMCFEEVWQSQVLHKVSSLGDIAAPMETIICFLSDPERQKVLKDALQAASIIFITRGESFKKLDSYTYQVSPGDLKTYHKALTAIRKAVGPVDAVLYLWAIEDSTLIRDYAPLVGIYQAIKSARLVLSNHPQRRFLLAGEFKDGLDRCYLESWIGFERSAKLIMPNMPIGLVYKETGDQNDGMTEWSRILRSELNAPLVPAVLYKEDGRYVTQIRPVPSQHPSVSSVKSGGTYLITGGCGGLGIIFAQHFANTSDVNLILTGRSVLSPEKQSVIQALEDSGTPVFYLQADVSDVKQMEQGINAAKKRFGHIHGVVHAAGIQGTKTIFDKEFVDFQRVLDPKVKGIQVLNEVLHEEPLDFVCYFSSSSAILGDFGTCDYSVANRFLMAYAEYRNELRTREKVSGKTVVINWPLWKDGGMSIGAPEETEFYLKTSGQRHLETDEGLAFFDKFLAGDGTQYLVLAGQPDRINQFLGLAQTPESDFDAPFLTTEPTAQPSGKGLPVKESVQSDLEAVMKRLLKISADKVVTTGSFADFGFDSISLEEFASVLSRHYGLDITPTVFFGYSSLEKLTDYFMTEHAEKISAFYQNETVEKPVYRPVRKQYDTQKEPALNKGVNEPIAVIGMSGRFPQADTVDEFWLNIKNGINCITEVPGDRWSKQDSRSIQDELKTNPDSSFSQRGGFLSGIDQFDPLFFEIPPSEARTMDPGQRIFLEEAWHAFEDAGYMAERLRGISCGVYVGVEEGDYGLRSGVGSINSNQNATLAARIAYTLNLNGPNLAMTAACSSGLVALHQACLALRQGDCEMALVGGVSLITSPWTYAALNQAGMLSPDGKCRVFDDKANGLVPAEAVGAVVIKPLSQSIADNDRIYGVIQGSGVNYDGKTNGITTPSPLRQAELIKTIYDKYGIDPTSINAIMAHSVGSRLGDPIELEALSKAFEHYTDKKQFCAIGSIKPLIGHTFAASGIVSLIVMLKAMKAEIIPPLFHYEKRNEYIKLKDSPFIINKQSKPWKTEHQQLRRGAMSTTGISGTNAHVVVEDYIAAEEQRSLSVYSASLPQLAVFSAQNKNRLRTVAQNMIDFLQREENQALCLSSLAYTLQVGREPMKERLAIITDSLKDLRQKLGSFESPDDSILMGTRDLNQNDSREDDEKIRTALRERNLKRLSMFWVMGARLPWEVLYEDRPVKIISLPAYPFKKQRCRISDHYVDDRKEHNEFENRAAEYYTLGAEAAKTEFQEEYLTFAPFPQRISGFSATRIWTNPDQFPDELALVKTKQVELRQVLFHGLDFKKIERVLDFGCGHGTDVIQIAETYPHVRTHGYTITRAQAALGNKRIAERGLESRATIFHKDSSKDLFPGRYDLIIGIEVSFHILDKEGLFKNISDSLNQNGTILLMDFLSNLQGPVADPNLEIHIPTCEKWIEILSKYHLVIDEIIDVSPEIANFLHDPDFEQNIKDLPEIGRDALQNFVHQAISLNKGWITYSLLKLRKDQDLSNEECVNHNRDKISNQTPYPEALASMLKDSRIPYPKTERDHEGAEIKTSIPGHLEKVKSSLISIFTRVLEFAREDVEDAETFGALGINSINAVELSVEVNREFGLRLPTSLVFEFNNLDALAKHLMTEGGVLADPSGAKRLKIPSKQISQQIRTMCISSGDADKDMKDQRRNDIAVIGVSCRCAGADEKEAFWQVVSQGKDCITTVKDKNWLEFFRRNASDSVPLRYGAMDNLDNFDSRFFHISTEEASSMDGSQRFLLEECYKALEDAAYDPIQLQGRRVGTYIGTGGGSTPTVPDYSGVAMMGSDPSISSARIAHFLDLKGPAIAINTACSSSLVAVDLAIQALKSKDIDMAIAGGISLWNHPGAFVSMNNAGMLSQTGECRPFDNRADGFVVGDGVGIVILKRLADAEQDGDPIYGVIRGSGTNQSGRTLGPTVPSFRAQSSLQSAVYEKTQTSAEDIQYIETHGTATKLGDAIEIQALSDTFTRFTSKTHICPIGSLKANIGHTAAASGVLSLIKVLLSLRNRQICPTINYAVENEHIDFKNSHFYVNTELQPWPDNHKGPRLAAVSALGYNGTNAHLLIEEYSADRVCGGAHCELKPNAGSRESERKGACLVVLSAKDQERLRAYAEKLLAFIRTESAAGKDSPELNIENIAYTLQVGRTAMEERVAFTAESIGELEDKLQGFCTGHAPGDLYQGRVENNKGSLSVFTQDEDMAKIIDVWIEKGKYTEILDLWVKGGVIDWNRLYGQLRPSRINLPTYPFARSRNLEEENVTVSAVEVKPESVSKGWHFSLSADPEKIDPALRGLNAKEKSELLLCHLAAKQTNKPVDQIDPHDGYFEMGLKSLGLIKMVQGIEHAIDVKLAPTIIFEYRTVSDLASYLSSTYPRRFDRLTVAEKKCSAEGPIVHQKELVSSPLSEGQKGLWALQKIYPEMSAYNVPICFRIHQKWDMEAFRKACRFLLKQYPILATMFKEVNGTPHQMIDPQAALVIEETDVSRWDAQKIVAALDKKNKEPFGLDEGPLLRISLFSVSDIETIVLFTIHHIVFDGTSFLPFIKTLLSAYEAFGAGKRLLPVPSDTQYRDYVEYEQNMLSGEEGRARLGYWKNILAGDLPVLNLPTDWPRLSASGFSGKTHKICIPSELCRRVKEFSKDQSIYSSVIFLGVFKTLLSRYTGQKDIIVGMPVSERTQDRFEKLIGFHINMIPIRSQYCENESFLAFVKRLRSITINGLANSYPFTALVRELNLSAATQAPVFQAAFLYQDFLETSAIDGLMHSYENSLAIEFVEEIHQEGEYEIALEVMERGEEFVLNLKYNPNLFHGATIERMLGHYVKLLDEMLAKPELRPRDISLLSEKEEESLLYDWNKTQAFYEKDHSVHQLFEKQAQETPGAIAVRIGDVVLTYEELDKRSTILAKYLQQSGVEPDVLVALCIDRSLEMIIGLLGILKAGGAYVPLDPEYPDERLAYMLEDSGSSMIVTEAGLADKVFALKRCVPQGNEIRTIVLDGQWDEIKEQALSQRMLEKKVEAKHLAYVIYTSGSTGKPKGVMIPHQALTNFLHSMANLPGLQKEDKLLAVTTIAFDIAALEIYLPLTQGGQCLICPNDKAKDAEKLKREIARLQPTVMQATPSTWIMLFESGWKNEEKLRIFCGGEALTESLKEDIIKTNSNGWNLFGPTETTIWSTIQEIKAEELITIGKPIANTEIYIIDPDQNLTPVGVAGELCLGGHGLARGYLNNPELTREKFVNNPFQAGATIYRTGDLARWLPDGTIECLGRLDHQVKIRGYRIELGEIENQLSQHPKLQQTAVIMKERGGDKQIIAYYVSNGSVDPHELRSYLRTVFPDYMIPSFFIPIDSLPLTPNKKTDRNALMNREIVVSRTETVSPPQSEIEEKVHHIWMDILNVTDVSTTDGFFELGGNSVSAVTITERLNNAFACDLTASILFKYPTIKGISRHISKLKGYASVPRAEEVDRLEFDSPSTNDNSEQVHGGLRSQKSRAINSEYYENSLAIIGISCQFPGAKNYHELWRNLREGRESARFFSQEELRDANAPEKLIKNPAYVPVQYGIEGKDYFDPGFFNLSQKNATLMDPQFRLLLLHSWRAMEDAGYISKEIPETSVFMATGNTRSQGELDGAYGVDDSDAYVAWLLAQGGSVSTMISYQLGLTGPSFAVHSNCSSSLVGLYAAYQSLQTNEAKYALVGASTLFPSPQIGYVFKEGMNFSSDGHCKTFDASADGMVPGEGAGVILVKKAPDAIRDGDHIYAILRGVGINNDGSEKAGFYAPGVKGQAELIRKVLRTSKVDPCSIGYVEAHGTGTKLGDPIEVMALSDAYQGYTERKQYCGIGSIKTNIGHLDTAAGLAGCIKVVLSLKNGEIPPSINYKNPNPEIDFKTSPFYVVNRLKRWGNETGPRRAALSSFGIGGTNGHAIFEEYIESPDQNKQSNAEEFNGAQALGQKAGVRGLNSEREESYLFVLSAKNEDRLRAYAEHMLEYVDFEHARQKNHTKGAHKSNFPDKEQENIGNMTYTLQVGRDAMEKRIGFVVESIGDLKAKLNRFLEKGSFNYDVKTIFRGCVKNNDHSPVATAADIDRLIREQDFSRIIELWVNGTVIDWSRLYGESKPSRMSLPTYPFAEEYCGTTTQCSEVKDKITDIDHLKGVKVMTPVWNSIPKPEDDLLYPALTSQVVIIGEISEQINGLQKIWPNARILEINAKDSIELLVNKLRFLKVVDHIVWIAPERFLASLTDDSFIREQTLGVIQVFRTVKALLAAGYGQKELGWTIITTQAQVVREKDIVNPIHASVHGFIGSLAKEYPNWKIRLLDMQVGRPWPLREMFTLPADVQGDALAYRGKEWFKQSLIPDRKTPIGSTFPNHEAAYRPKGVYVVIGGAGGIGVVWSRYMIEKYQAKIIWIGRRQEDAEIQGKLDLLSSLEGPAPVYVAADASNQEALQKAYETIKKTHTRIHGVVHSAVGLFDQSLEEMEEDRFQNILSVKINVSVRIAQVFEEDSLDFVLFFSSMASFGKSGGMSGYAAGCAFEDAFSLWLSSGWACKVKVINWGYWNIGSGAKMPGATITRLKQDGIEPMSPEEGMEILEKFMIGSVDQVAVMKTSLDRLIQDENLPTGLFPDRANSHVRESDCQTLVHSTSTASDASVSDTVLTILSDLLTVKVNELHPDTPLDEYGFDSIMLVQLNQQLKARIDPSIELDRLRECKTLKDLMVIVPAKRHGDILLQQPSNSLMPSKTTRFPELVHLNNANEGRPVFWIHGGLGGVEIYQGIAENIRRPFYGIQARGWMTDRAPLHGIQAMAAYYVEIIHAVQPEGPYDLGGYSLGGVLAYEITRQLQEFGPVVSSIVMLDSYDMTTVKNIRITEKGKYFEAVNIALQSMVMRHPEKITTTLIHRDDIEFNLDNEAFMKQLIIIAGSRGLNKTERQLKNMMRQMVRLQSAYETDRATIYPLPAPQSVSCYYFRDKSGLLLGEMEPYYRLPEDQVSVDHPNYWSKWEQHLPNLHIMDVDSPNHLMLLSEPEVYKTILDFCETLYSKEGISAEFLVPFKRKTEKRHGKLT
jgi:amino acid adenylation domain-containing protein